MNLLARIGLAVITSVSAVCIAACYGVAVSFSRAGRVVDAATKHSIRGIRVSCTLRGAVEDTAYSDPDGAWAVEGPCDALLAEDVDGDLNGAYEAKSVEFPTHDGVVIELDPP